MPHELAYVRPQPPSADDRGTLKLLGIFYCAFGGMEIAGITLMLFLNFLHPPIPLAVIGVLLVPMGLFTLSGVCMLTKRFRVFSFAVAICTCLAFPIGTMLGVWTIVVLNKPGVGQLYLRDAGPNGTGGNGVNNAE
jgi:hypothetical protein